VSYLVFGLFLLVVGLFAAPGVAAGLIRGPDLLAQLIVTPLIAGWSVWVAITISTRASDVRVAQQLAILASLPPVAVTTLVALGIIPPTLVTAAVAAGLLAALNVVGVRIVALAFDPERLVDGLG
jgi:ABC-2 type transport system permease protein